MRVLLNSAHTHWPWGSGSLALSASELFYLLIEKVTYPCTRGLRGLTGYIVARLTESHTSI